MDSPVKLICLDIRLSVSQRKMFPSRKPAEISSCTIYFTYRSTKAGITILQDYWMILQICGEYLHWGVGVAKIKSMNIKQVSSQRESQRELSNREELVERMARTLTTDGRIQP